jgi:hypothetical protein
VFASSAAASCSEQGGMDGDAQRATDPAAASALSGSGGNGTPAAAHEALEQPGALCPYVAACARECVRAPRGLRVPLSATKSADAKRARAHFRSTPRRPAVSSGRAAWQARPRTRCVACIATRHAR